ncbi:hypothetical protein HanRHA438_Chr11g0525551 [Helianthus annuus]|nr:hypothetical protein HanRHA438_Chr11g0525551 [Helianthus annuus]
MIFFYLSMKKSFLLDQSVTIQLCSTSAPSVITRNNTKLTHPNLVRMEHSHWRL